ncbi:MAG: glycosyltransferase family 2 protein [Deltaproteobacteria bacterium]|nr:glycosyltransferase family 2 protein [Deltaproteobacteria bacterium]
MAPEVSVIIPTYNRANMVAEAVKSVLLQSGVSFELIVVDDGSTDSTEKKLEPFGSSLQYHRQTHSGVSAARNRGVQLSRAPLLAFLDSDDLWLPGKLLVQKTFMDRNPGMQICQTDELWWRNGRRVNPKRYHQKPSGDIFRASLERCLVSPSAVMIRRPFFEQLGGFDEELPMAEDYDLWLRAALVIKRGGHADQLSSTPGIDRYRIRALEKLLLNGRLSRQQYSWVWQTLERKCLIYGRGCLKRSKLAEANKYLNKPALYSTMAVYPRNKDSQGEPSEK